VREMNKLWEKNCTEENIGGELNGEE